MLTRSFRTRRPERADRSCWLAKDSSESSVSCSRWGRDASSGRLPNSLFPVMMRFFSPAISERKAAFRIEVPVTLRLSRPLKERSGERSESAFPERERLFRWVACDSDATLVSRLLSSSSKWVIWRQRAKEDRPVRPVSKRRSSVSAGSCSRPSRLTRAEPPTWNRSRLFRRENFWRFSASMGRGMYNSRRPGRNRSSRVCTLASFSVKRRRP